jgi:hypothetical protein
MPQGVPEIVANYFLPEKHDLAPLLRGKVNRPPIDGMPSAL